MREDFPGTIRRIDIAPDTGATSAQTWVTGFHSGDDDPVGTAWSSDYTGSLLWPGDMVSTDRRFNRPRMIYTGSPLTPENEILVPDDLLVIDMALNGPVGSISIKTPDANAWIDDARDHRFGHVRLDSNAI